MAKPSRHLMAFGISVELLQEMMTVGWETGTANIVRCIDGLPANARFEFIQSEHYTNYVCLVFSHPTWPAVESLGAIPYKAAIIRTVPIREPREATEV